MESGQSNPVEAHYTRLLTTKGFIEAFWEFRPEVLTHEQAYECVEAQYEGVFGKRKYSDFDSFKAVMYRYSKFKK